MTNLLDDYLSIVRWKEHNEEKIKHLSKDRKAYYNAKYLEAYKKVENNTLFDSVEFGDENLYSGSFFKDCPTTKDGILKFLNNKPKYRIQQVAKLGALVTKFYFFPNGTPLNISSTSKSLLAIYKTQQIASKVLLLAQKVGAFKCVNSKYRFGTDKWNYSKQYVINKHVGKLILELCKDYNINPENQYMKKARVVKNVEDNRKLPIDHIKKAYNLTLGKKRSVPGLTREEVIQLIYDQYPQITDFQKVVDFDNEHYLDRPELQVVFRPSEPQFDKQGFLCRTGFRAYSDFCSFKSRDKMLKLGDEMADCYDYERTVLKPFGKVFREDYVKQYFYEHGIDDFVHWDTTGSIYYIQYYKKHGLFIPDGVDPYEMLAGQKFKSKDERNKFKLLAAMQNMFDWSAKSVYAKLEKVYGLKNKALLQLDKEHGQMIDKETGKLIPYSFYVVKHFNDLIQQYMNNKDKNTEVFLDESCIYAQMAHVLREHGYTVLQVYDSFWIGKPNKQLDVNEVASTMMNLMKNTMVNYFSKYYNVEQSSCSKSCSSYADNHVQTDSTPLSLRSLPTLVQHIKSSQEVTVMKQPTPQDKPIEEPRPLTPDEFQQLMEWWFNYKPNGNDVKE